MIKQWLVFTLKLSVAGGLIWWLLASGRLDLSPVVSEVMSSVHFIGIAVIFASLPLQALRWHMLLIMQRVVFPYGRMVRWTIIGEFFGLALPGAAGTELARVYYLLRNAPNAKIAALSSVLLDRVLALCSLLFLGAVAFLVLLSTGRELTPAVVWMGAAMALCLGGAGIGFLIFAFGPSRALLLRLTPKRYAPILDSSITAYTGQIRGLVLCFMVSVATHVLFLASFVVAGAILESPLRWEEMFLISPLVMIVNTLPLSPTGIGVGETAASFLFAEFGAMNGAVIMVVVRAWMVIMQLAGGIVYLFHRHQSDMDEVPHQAK